jgi:alginate production protein
MHQTKISSLVLLLFAICGYQFAFAQGLIGQRMKLTGRWNGTVFEVIRAQERDSREDSQRGRVSGHPQAIDPTARTMRIGPFLIEWNDHTRFSGISSTELSPAHAVEVSGKHIGQAHLLASAIEPGDDSPDRVQLLGSVSEGDRQADGSLQVTILDIPVTIPKNKYIAGSELTRRPDDRPPDSPLTVTILGAPVTLGGKLETKTRYRHNLSLDPDRADETFRLDQELSLRVFTLLTENVAMFLEGKALYEKELYDRLGRRKLSWSFERGETWLYASNLFDSRFSLQVGRQNVREPRSWWWDKDLDAVRLHYDHRYWHAELSVAQQLGSVSTQEDQNDPEQVGVFRLLGHSAWSWAKNQRLDMFFLYQNDHSGKRTIGQTVKEDQEDESDAALVWVGSRTSGKIDLDRFGDLDYRAEGAWVGGRETLLDFKKDADRPGSRRLKSVEARNVHGWAFDSGLTWAPDLPGRPTLIFGYAFGSGDSNPEHGTDHAFRQSGLFQNKSRLRGVTRFRYYGELLQPELSNLHLWTLGLGFRFWKESSIELIYHRYYQVDPAPLLRGARIDIDPLGQRSNIGEEWDLIIGMEEWDNFVVKVFGSLFRAGSAYGHQRSGEIASSLILQLDYNF